MKVLEQFTEGKHATTPSEDAVVVSAYYAAVIDGATPKSDFRYTDGETPGHMAARLLCQSIIEMPKDFSAPEAIDWLSQRMQVSEDIDPKNRPTASLVIYNDLRREVWMVGDCQMALIDRNGELQIITNQKRIDIVLSRWRRTILLSYLNRGIRTEKELLIEDPGRKIIQPFISRQVKRHNIDFAVMDGTKVPERLIKRIAIPNDVTTLILASDGYPQLCKSLEESEQYLREQIMQDPLCINSLLGTKGIHPDAQSYDDRTYIKLEI